MIRDPVVVKPSTTLAELMEIFRRHGFHSLPVVAEDRPIGMVTIEDIFKIFRAHPPAVGRVLNTISYLEEERAPDISKIQVPPGSGQLFLVEDLMTRRFAVIEEGATLDKALQAMGVHQTRKLLVVKEGRLTGLVTYLDIIYGVLKAQGVLS
jgi:CBS domain-containing protein